MGVYYPGMAVNLIIRFDEAVLSGATLRPQSADSLSKNLVGFAGAGGSTKRAGPLAGTKDRLSRIISIIPRTASLELPAYRQAGKFSLTFAWRDMPLDPRVIRALGVEVHVGAVSATDFQRGMLGFKDDDRLASFLTQTDENLMLAGVVDTLSTAFTEKGSEVRLDGRDVRAIFIDGKIAPETIKALNVEQPINKVVEDILKSAPSGAQIQVNVDPNDWPLGIVPAPGAKELVNRVNKGADGTKSKAGVKGSATSGNGTGLSFWDLITNFCFIVGAVPYFRGHALWIRPARSLFDQAKAGTKEGPNLATPFAGGKRRTIKTGDTSSEDISFRRMVYGRNVATLTFERKFGGTKVPTVVAVSLDPDAKGGEKLLEVEWPADADGADAARVEAAKVTNVDPSGNESATEKMRIPVPGIKDKERLRLIAKQVYEEIGRGEMGGACSSKDLASLGGGNDDADILRLRPGDAVEFLVDATGAQGLPPISSELTQASEASTLEVARKFAARLGKGNEDMAQVLAGAARGQVQALQSVFRVANVKYSWDASSGMGVDFDFQNYVESRYDVTPTLGEITNNLLNALDKIDLKLKAQAEAAKKNPARSATPKRGG